MNPKYTVDDVNSSGIIFIAMDFLASGLSLRKFAQKNCGFSHVTLRDRLVRNLPDLNQELSQEVNDLLSNRKTKPINEDSESKARVLQATKLLLEKGLTIEEISYELNSTVMTIYRDLTRRLPQLEDIDSETKKNVIVTLKEHSLDNLNKRSK